MITPHLHYRLNPQRAIFVSGVIDSALVTALTPEILRLHHSSRDPISVYIDSPGGQPNAMEALLALLRLTDQSASGPCRVITAATNRAASAAADLLASGDYAIAYPNSSLLYHGVRTRPNDPLTVELTSILNSGLRSSNGYYAMELARRIEDRFAFRFLMSRQQFEDVREKVQRPKMSDLECFIEVINENLSSEARKVWVKARRRHQRYERLFETVVNKTRGDVGKMSRAEMESKAIKAIVDFELKAAKKNPDWTFSTGGIGNLADDFFLFVEYLSNASQERVHKWATLWKKVMLTEAEIAEIDAIQDEKERDAKLIDKVEPILHPLWSFFVGLCHALQTDENYLTATDAYWMGLIDEVVGADLLSLRWFIEFSQDASSS